MKPFLILILLAGLCSNCKKNSVAPLNGRGAIDFIVTDIYGGNLLDPSNPDGYKEKDIDMYFRVKGEKKRFYNPDLTYPKNLRIHIVDSVYRLTFFADESALQTTTFLQWRKSSVVSEDTIRCKYDKFGYLEKVWLNGVQENSVETYGYTIKVIK